MPGPRKKTLYELINKGAIKAIIFDFDGTILDVNEPLHKSVAEVFHKHGIYGEWEQTMAQVGSVLDTVQAIPLPKIILEAYDIFNLVTALEGYRMIKKLRVAASIFSKYQKLAENAKLCQGVELLLAALAEKVPLYIVSHNLTIKVQESLAKHKLAQYFAGVYGADQLPALKPNPEAVAFAAAQVGPHKPEEIVVVGDMPTDIQAGQAAGYWTVAVSTGFIPYSHLEAAQPDLLVRNFVEFYDALEGGQNSHLEAIKKVAPVASHA